MDSGEKLLTKTQYFEYFVNKLYDSNSDKINNDLSIVKTQKLLFFLTISVKNEKDEYPLLEVFNNFFALPYGHVESDIYTSIKNDTLETLKINRFKTTLSGVGQIQNINPEDKIIKDIDLGLLNLIRFKLDKKTASYLVDLSHCHQSWINNFRKAISEQKTSRKIPDIDIISEEKYFSL